MTMIKRSLAFLSLLVLTTGLKAQEKDFGIWYGTSADYKLNKKVELNFSGNIRTFRNAAKIEEAFLEGGISYGFNKYVTLGAAYRITKNIENNDSYYIRHKFLADVKGSVPAGNFRFSLRLRFQTEIRNYIEENRDKYPYYTGRIKFKALYKTPAFPVDPYAYFETFVPMFSDNSGLFGKNRFSGGIEFNITKKQSVDAEYIFQRDFMPHVSDLNIISVNYNIKF